MSEQNQGQDPQQQLQAKIKELIPINELPPHLVQQLLQRAQIMEVKKSRFIFKQGDKDSYSYYLLDGEIELYADKQLNSVIQSDSDRAKYALAQLQPRQFSAKAKTALKVLMLDRSHLDQLMVLAQESTDMGAGGGDVEVDIVDGVDDDTDWMTKMLQSELFSRIPTANIHQLFALLEEVEYKAGDVVIKQGEPGEEYYIISEGHCAVSRRPSPKSNDVKLAELKSGDSFGEEALISDSTRNATVTMVTDGILMRLDKATFVELVKKPTMQSLEFDEADALVGEGSAKWLDVRFPNEHKESAIAGSINMPLNSLRLQLDKLDPEMIYVLYCDTGARSSTGMFLLAERGFQVSFLDGGLVNNPEAVGVQTVVPKAPEPAKEPVKEEVKPEPTPAKPAEDKAAKAKAEAEQKAQEEAQRKQAEADAKKNAEAEAKKQAQEEARKKVAAAEAKKKAQEDEAKLKKLQAENDKKMQAEKKKLEEIYNKNAKDMEKIQKAKEAAEEKIRKEREELEKQAEEARKQIEEAKRLKEEAAEAAKKELEQLEASKKKLEEEAEKKRLEEEERERRLQEEVKAKIEEERKKMAEQYERTSKEMEELQRSKEQAAAEAAKAAAKEEAQKMIDEYKQSHDKERAEAEARLKAERQKLEQEAKKIQESMKQIQQAKLEAEHAKQEALQEADRLKEKQMDSTNSKEQRDQLEVEIKAAQEKAVVAEREIEDAVHKEKLTESAQQENEADLVNQKKQEDALLAQIQGDLEDFEEKQEEEKASITQVQMQADMMKRIKMKAAEAKKKASQANESLLDDISSQLTNQ